MSTMSVAEAVEELFLQAVGTSTGTTDAFNSINGAVNGSPTVVQSILNSISGAAGLTNVGASSIQTFQKLAGSSAEAVALSQDAVKYSAWASFYANAGLLALQATNPDPRVQVQNNTLLSTIGSGLSVLSTKSSGEVAVALGVAAAGFLMAGVKTDDSSKFVNTLASLKSQINSYYSGLPPDQQSIFASSFTSNVQSMLGGGMLVPTIDSSGQITGYQVDIPTSVTAQPDGSTLYTFESGITYQQGSKNCVGPLQESSISSGGENIWTIPQGANNGQVQIGMFSDGSYSDIFKDSSNNSVAEVYIAGSGSDSVYSTSGTTLVCDAGSGNQLSLSGAGIDANVRGAGNIVIAAGNGMNISVSGASDNTTVLGDNTTVTDSGASGTTTLSGAGDIATILGLGSSGTGMGATDTINAVGTNGSVQASGQGGTASVSATGASSAQQGFSQDQLADLLSAGISTLASSQAQTDASTNRAFAALQSIDPAEAAVLAAQEQQNDAITAQDIQLLNASQSVLSTGSTTSAAALLASLSTASSTSSQGFASSSLAALQAAMSSSLPLSSSSAITASTSSAGASSTSANSALAQMIQVMAAYGASAGATTTITPPTQTLTALLAASATH